MYLRPNVGDTFRMSDWTDTWEVVRNDGNHYYSIRKVGGDGTIYPWYIFHDYVDYIFNEGRGEGYKPLSPIERKIALMERRFKKKQEEKKKNIKKKIKGRSPTTIILDELL